MTPGMNCGVSWAWDSGAASEAAPERGEQNLPPEPPSGNPRPPPVLANPAETSPPGSRYLYKYVYDDSHLRSSFFSRGVPGWPPLKNLPSQTRQALPTASSGIRQLAPGGKARAFADIVGDRLGQSEQRQFQNL